MIIDPNYQPEPPSNQPSDIDDLEPKGFLDNLLFTRSREREESELLDNVLNQAKTVCNLVIDSDLPLTISSNRIATLAIAICQLQQKLNDYQEHQQNTMEM